MAKVVAIKGAVILRSTKLFYRDSYSVVDTAFVIDAILQFEYLA
jgi:hypothetical protein